MLTADVPVSSKEPVSIGDRSALSKMSFSNTNIANISRDITPIQSLNHFTRQIKPYNELEKHDSNIVNDSRFGVTKDWINFREDFPKKTSSLQVKKEMKKLSVNKKLLNPAEDNKQTHDLKSNKQTGASEYSAAFQKEETKLNPSELVVEPRPSSHSTRLTNDLQLETNDADHDDSSVSRDLPNDDGSQVQMQGSMKQPTTLVRTVELKISHSELNEGTDAELVTSLEHNAEGEIFPYKTTLAHSLHRV